MRTQYRYAGSLLGVIVLSVILTYAHHVEAITNRPETTVDVRTALTKEKIVREANTARKAQDLPSLTVDPLLAKAAQKKADDMARKGYFSHDTPSGIKFFEFLNKVGYKYRYAGENLAIHYRSASTVMYAWLNSPTHRSNILNAKYTETGIGLAYGEYKGKMEWYIVQLLGREQRSQL